MKRKLLENIGLLLLMAALSAATVLACTLLYRYDNKYTFVCPQAREGYLCLDETALEEYPLLFLLNGWEYYGHRLLTPEDFTPSSVVAPKPDQYIFIGQYGGFEAGDDTASPHGSASYRLCLELPEESQAYLLELPEIFSAYRVYVNGKLAAEMGNPDPANYHPETGNSRLYIQAQGNTEILIAVSDFSHLYSGMVYPPAFGKPEAVTDLLDTRFLFRAILCVTALTIGAVSAFVGVLNRKSWLPLLYALLCLFFVGYVSYPITRTFFSSFYPFYAIENFSFCAMIFIVILLQREVCGSRQDRNDNLSRIFLFFGLIVCACSLILPFALSGSNLRAMLAYSSLISAYEWVTASFITYTGLRAVGRGTVHSHILLGGSIVFDSALVMDRLLPLHEPIVSGWFPELASFVLVLSIALVIAREVSAQYKINAVLEERSNSIARLYQMQQAYYDILQDKMAEARTMRHDLRHHFVMIDGLVKNRQYDELQTYVATYQAAFAEGEAANYSAHHVVNVLAQHYAYLAKQNAITYDFRSEIGKDLPLTDADLCSLLSNLCENALEACLRTTADRRFVRVAIAQIDAASIAIRVENSTDDRVRNEGGAFLSSKAEGRRGYGLESVRSIAETYDGSADFRWDSVALIFTGLVIIHAKAADHSDL